ncbi:inactive dipeptidyl peptidase 10-like isoform X3 [Styela clava]
MDIATAASHVAFIQHKDEERENKRRNFRRHSIFFSRKDGNKESQELAVIPQERNWKGIFLSVVVITIVCVIVGISAWLLQPPESVSDYNYVYDFDAMFDMEWKPYTTTGEWIGDSFVYRDRYSNILKTKGREVEILITNETMQSLGIYKASISPDFKYALLSSDIQKVYRYSTTAKYFIYTIDTKSHVSLHDKSLQYAGWGMVGSQLAYVINSDVYYKSSAEDNPHQITTTGKKSKQKVINGIADWIYEEEVLSGSKAHWFSKDGSYLAYASFDDTLVPQVDIIIYNTPYPTIEKINYPKTGYKNPIVKLFIHNLRTNKNVEVPIPESVKELQPLFNSLVWASDESVLITWMNRYQNISVTSYCSLSSSSNPKNMTISCRDIYEQHSEGWLETLTNSQNGRSAPTQGSGKTYFQREEKSIGGSGKFTHLMMVDYSKDSVTTRFLTSGNWEVTDISGYNEQLNKVFFISTEKSPMDRHLYSVDINEDRPTPFCHTCDSSCKYTSTQMSSDATGAIIQCLGPGVPFATYFNVTNQEANIIEGNKELREKYKNTIKPDIIVETIPISGESGNYEFQAKLFLPPNAQLKKHIPLLLDIYAGPGSQTVNSKFSLDWKTFLATNKDIAVMTFDGRGSGFRGSNVLKEVNRRLGVYEIEDQITAIKKVLEKHHYLNRDKVAVWGWSYGGYASAMLATHPMSLSENLTKCAISVAPVTDWHLYDTIYTERFMGSRDHNFKRYMESSLLPRAESFKFFKYLLIHGTRDDNVHFQNSAVLENELVRAGIVHRYQVYTDETHSLNSQPKWTHRHLYKLMTQFLIDCYANT